VDIATKPIYNRKDRRHDRKILVYGVVIVSKTDAET